MITRMGILAIALFVLVFAQVGAQMVEPMIYLIGETVEQANACHALNQTEVYDGCEVGSPEWEIRFEQTRILIEEENPAIIIEESGMVYLQIWNSPEDAAILCLLEYGSEICPQLTSVSDSRHSEDCWDESWLTGDHGGLGAIQLVRDFPNNSVTFQLASGEKHDPCGYDIAFLVNGDLISIFYGVQLPFNLSYDAYCVDFHTIVEVEIADVSSYGVAQFAGDYFYCV